MKTKSSNAALAIGSVLAFLQAFAAQPCLLATHDKGPIPIVPGGLAHRSPDNLRAFFSQLLPALPYRLALFDESARPLLAILSGCDHCGKVRLQAQPLF